MGAVSVDSSDFPAPDNTRAPPAEKETLSEDNEIPMKEAETILTNEERQPVKNTKTPLDNNTYSTKKTIAQGMMDLALLTANASQLKLLIKYNQERDAIFVIHVTCICLSIVLQIIIGAMLIAISRYNINKQSHHSRADLINNLTVGGVFLITVINVFASSFSDST